MKRRLITLIFTLLTLLACLLYSASAAETDAGQDWTVSRSKTATNLNEDFKSDITLSLPAKDEKLVSDVVFVLDESSCSQPVKEEVAGILENLYQQIEGTGASIKVGAVQFRGEVTKMPLTELTETTKDQITEFMGQRPQTGGSNMSAGLLAGKKMLDEDTGVEAERKYLILVSDGITYIWDNENTEVQENYGVNFAGGDTPNQPMLAGPDGWDVRYHNGFVPEDWNTHMTEIIGLSDKTISEKAELYDRSTDISQKKFVSYSERNSYASTVDIALLKAYQIYTDIAAEYHAYAITAGVEGEMNVYPFGPSFMKFLANGRELSFSNIQNEIYYLLSAGSSVRDEIGKTDGYNFDLVPGSFKLERGNQELQLTAMEDENHYGFGEKLTNGRYEFEITYYPESPDAAEYFIWDINVDISQFEPVQLTYTVLLTDPQTEEGSYGQYDGDGSKGYSDLHTNNSAILSVIDSNQNPVGTLPFARPTVSYTVRENPPTGNKMITLLLGALSTASAIGAVAVLSHKKKSR